MIPKLKSLPDCSSIASFHKCQHIRGLSFPLFLLPFFSSWTCSRPTYFQPSHSSDPRSSGKQLSKQGLKFSFDKCFLMKNVITRGLKLKSLSRCWRSSLFWWRLLTSVVSKGKIQMTVLYIRFMPSPACVWMSESCCILFEYKDQRIVSEICIFNHLCTLGNWGEITGHFPGISLKERRQKKPSDSLDKWREVRWKRTGLFLAVSFIIHNNARLITLIKMRL